MMELLDKSVYGNIKIIVIINAVLLFFAANSISTNLMIKRAEEVTKNYVEVDVTIDDVSFEYDGQETDSDGDVTYNYKMNRILHFTYDGQEYAVKNTKTYSSGLANYNVELRTGYKDDGVYKVNPANPNETSICYGSSSAGAILEGIFKAIGIAFVVVLAVIDIRYVIYSVKKKKDVFDD